MARLLRALRRTDEGMSTAEYCVGIVAACAFAMVLYHVLTGGLVKHLVTTAITQALKMIPF